MYQGDPAQPFPDQTPGHESYYGGGATPAYSDYNPGGKWEKSSLIISLWRKNAFDWSLQEVRPQVMEVGTQPQSTLPPLLPCLRWEYIKNALHGFLST